MEAIDNRVVTYHRKPTKGDIVFGHGAMHYKEFPIEEVINYKITNRLALKKWVKCEEDGLRYYY